MWWWVLEWFPVSQVIASVGVRPGYIMISDHFFYMPMVAVAMLVMLAYDKLSGLWVNDILPLRLTYSNCKFKNKYCVT